MSDPEWLLYLRAHAPQLFEQAYSELGALRRALASADKVIGEQYRKMMELAAERADPIPFPIKKLLELKEQVDDAFDKTIDDIDDTDINEA